MLRRMKYGAVIVCALLAASCENSRSRLDTIKMPPPTAEAPAPGVNPPAKFKLDKSGTTEQRLARLEDYVEKNAEAIDFLSKVYAQQKQQQAQQERDEPAEDAVFAVDIDRDVKAGQVDGPKDALVTIVKAFDFACPYCQRSASTMTELVKDYQGKVRVVYKNFVVHPQVATDAHLASCAAAKQGKYLAFKDAFWEKAFLPYASARDPSKLGKDNIMVIAKDLGLDTGKLEADMKSDECQKQIQGDMQDLAPFNVNATPTFFINGQFVGGALPKEQFKKIIDEKLAIAEKSGVPGSEYYAKEILGKGEKKFRSKMDPKP